MALTPDRFFTGTVTARREITADLWTIRVDPGGAFPFTAGQYATLGLEDDAGHLVERAYSIVSSPLEPQLEFFVELVTAGALTPRLHRLGEGARVTIRRAAKGRFLRELSAPGDHLFLATVTGVAPFVSLLRTLAAQAEGPPRSAGRLFLIQGASRSTEFGYREELDALARRLPCVTYVPTVSRPWDEPEWRGEIGRVDDVIRKYADQWFPDRAGVSAHLCGHPQMIDNGKAILSRAGWSKGAIHEESYFVLP